MLYLTYHIVPMSKYLQSLTSYLHDQGLLKDKLNNALQEHDEIFCSKPSVKMPFGAHRGKTLREIYEFKPSYIDWLVKQSYIKEKFTDIYQEAEELLR